MIVISTSERKLPRNLFGILALISGWSTTGHTQSPTAVDVYLSSVEISNKPLSGNWQVIGGEFSDTDRIRIGLDVAAFDGSSIIQYILWIAYEGRRWPSFDPERMLRLTIDDSTHIMELFRRTSPVLVGGQITDKFEFRVKEDQLNEILQGKDVSFTITSGNATATRELHSEEKETLRSFIRQVGE